MEERYTELFQNVYGAKNEHPLNKIEEKREEIKGIVKEALGMLNQARDMAFGIDETEIQDDITNALNIFLAAEEKQQELPPGENLFTACTDEELFMFYDAFETETGFEYLPKLNRIRSQYASFRRCYMDLNFEISHRWHTEKKEEFERYHETLNLYVFADNLENFKKSFENSLPGAADYSKIELLPENIVFDENKLKFWEIVGFDQYMKCLIVRNIHTMVAEYKGISVRYWNTECLNSVKDIKAALETEKKDLQDLKADLQDMQDADELTEKMQEIYEQYDFEDECDIENFCINRTNLIHRIERELENFRGRKKYE